MIIKGLFGNSDEGQNKKAEFTKFCFICAEPMNKEASAAGDSYCKSCDDNGHQKDAAHWKAHYASKRANSLSPQMQKLADKLAENKSLIEGRKVTRDNNDNHVKDRNLGEIRRASVASNAVDFSVIKAQVSSLLPQILAELGLKDKVDASLLVDLMVPVKIASPIVNLEIGKSVIRNIVCEAVAHMNPGFLRQAGVKTHGTPQTFDANTMPVLHDGLRRVSNEYAARSRVIGHIAAEQEAKEQEDSDYNKPSEDEKGDYTPDDSIEKSKDGVDVGSSEAIADGSVYKLPDSEADAAIAQDKSPNDPEFLHQEEPMLMQQAGVRRVHQMDSASRSNLSAIKTANELKKNNNILKFANKLHASFPVETVKLSAKDKNVIENYPPLSNFTASFTDNSTVNWNCYKTDSGYLALSNKTAFHTKDLKSFANFIESDDTFSNWNHLPEPDVASLIPVSPVPEVHVVDLPPVDNSCDCDNHDEDANSQQNEEMLLNLVLELLPDVEDMFPDDNEDTVHDLALSAALDILEENMNKKAADLANPAIDEIGKHVSKGLDHFVTKVPGAAPLANAVKPVIDKEKATHVDHDLEGGAGNGAFDSLNKIVNHASVHIPNDKQKQINQIVSQLHKSKDEESGINLMASLQKVTPHLNDNQRKALLPKQFHGLHDEVISSIASEAADDSLTELMKVTADLSQTEYELSVESLLEMGYDENAILAVAEERFSEKEDRQHDHIKKTEMDNGKSEKEADSIAWATINKAKK